MKQSEATLRGLQDKLPDDAKPVKLDWKDLAAKGGVPQLYGWHRQLSGLSSHVTGLSIITGIEQPDGGQARLGPLQRKQHFMMMMGATAEGARRHTELLEDAEGNDRAIGLIVRLAAASDKWVA